MAKAKVEKEKDQGVRPSLRAAWGVICNKQRGLMLLMIALVVVSVILLIISLTTLRPQNSVVIVGYNDVFGGYQRASWANMLAFPLMAIIFGVLHNLLAIRMFQKYGKDAAMVFVGATILLVVLSVLTIFRLLGEW